MKRKLKNRTGIPAENLIRFISANPVGNREERRAAAQLAERQKRREATDGQR